MVVTDTLPTQLSGAMYTLDYGTGPSAPGFWMGSVGVGTLAPDDSVDVVITATVDAGTPSGTILSNTGTAESTTDDPTPANNSATATTTVDTEADLAITKLSPATATAGDPAGFDYALTVNNNGPSNNVGGFTVTDVLPAGLTYDDAASTPACAESPAGTVTCTNTTGLAAGGSTMFTVHVTLASTVDSGTVLSNAATVASGGTTDPNSANNTSNTATTTVEEDVQLSVVKTFGSDTVTAGGASQTFTVDVTNSGVSDADNVESERHGRPAAARRLDPPATSRALPPSQSISCSLAHLAAGATKSITVTYHVGATTNSDPGVANTARRVSDEDTATRASTRSRSSRTCSCRSRRRSTSTRYGGGAAKTFTVDVHNSGVSDADNVSLTDTSTRGWSSTRSRRATTRARTATEASRSLLARASRGGRDEVDHRHLPRRLDDRQRPVRSTTRRMPLGRGRRAIEHDTVAIVEDVNLSVDEDVRQATVTAGGAGQTFTVDVTNSGVSDADNVSLTDTVDSRLIVDSIAAATTPAPRRSQSISCSLAHLARATRSRSRSPTTSRRRRTARQRSATPRPRTPTRTAPAGSDSVAIVEDVSLSVTKTFDSATVTAGGAPARRSRSTSPTAASRTPTT